MTLDLTSAGARLRRLRLDHSMTQAALAEQLGLSRVGGTPTISRWEHNHHRPSRAVRRLVSLTLGSDPWSQQ
jgi:transcriptional regulator with XRE-family HTH domain